jgi:hypothetical protein
MRLFTAWVPHRSLHLLHHVLFGIIRMFDHDTLADGRVRLRVGVGWQVSEYEVLRENFRNRGKCHVFAGELM